MMPTESASTDTKAKPESRTRIMYGSAVMFDICRRVQVPSTFAPTFC